jgi:omega-6 fatty acid desaturase (delta-12 desaturase)
MGAVPVGADPAAGSTLRGSSAGDAPLGRAAHGPAPALGSGLAHRGKDLRAVTLAFQRAAPGVALFQVGTTIVPLLLMMMAMHAALALGWWWVVSLLALPAAGLTVRTFVIQHDCGHGSFLPSRRANDLLGRLCGLLTLTPYANWRRQHAQHHGTWNDLDRRDGRGSDIYSTCLTLAEYRRLTPWARRWHRLARHPLVALVLLPPLIFLFVYRVPFDTPAAWREERRSVQATNLALLLLYGGLGLALGFGPTLVVLLAVMVPASIAGVWLFSLQHHFEGAHWARHEEWNPVVAAIGGTSFLRLPRILQWLTGSIGFHHVHHLAPRIPNYRLEACHHAHPAFAEVRVLGIRDGLRASRYALWDEESDRMVTFAEAERGAPAAG